MREKIRTFSGIHMSPADPRPEEICIEDIAHALSLMTRANGHFPVFYSVAQHSLDCAAMAQAEGRVCCTMRARHICRISPGR